MCSVDMHCTLLYSNLGKGVKDIVRRRNGERESPLFRGSV
jgi:hypothetical protein